METENKIKRWHVGTMNDALFIIDEPPRPAPIDHHNDTLKTKVIAKVSEPHEEGWSWVEYQRHAALLAAAPELLEMAKEGEELCCSIIDDFWDKLSPAAMSGMRAKLKRFREVLSNVPDGPEDNSLVGNRRWYCEGEKT